MKRLNAACSLIYHICSLLKIIVKFLPYFATTVKSVGHSVTWPPDQDSTFFPICPDAAVTGMRAALELLLQPGHCRIDVLTIPPQSLPSGTLVTAPGSACIDPSPGGTSIDKTCPNSLVNRVNTSLGHNRDIPGSPSPAFSSSQFLWGLVLNQIAV